MEEIPPLKWRGGCGGNTSSERWICWLMTVVVGTMFVMRQVVTPDNGQFSVICGKRSPYGWPKDVNHG